MPNLELTPEEAKVVRETLRDQITELFLKVQRSTRHDDREMLKDRRELLDGVLNRLDMPQIAA